MKFSLAAFAVLLSGLAAGQALASGFDQATQAYLEGIWLVGRQPDKGACISHSYLETQIEFEFRKSGGRALIFEPPDLFTVIAIPEGDKKGDVLFMKARSRNGALVPYLRLRPSGPDRIEMLPHPESDARGESQFAYRCGGPDLSVNASTTMAQLALLTPVLSGSQAFPAVEPGVADADLCKGQDVGAESRDRRELQFELLGPVHYWVFGVGSSPEQSIEFDFVRSVTQLDAHTLKLAMQKHLANGEGWDVAKARGKTYTLTVIDRGGRIEIPELSTSFVRCRPEESGSSGMHRW